MSKIDKNSYEEVHKKLGEELEKAYLKREVPKEDVPEFDFSFLDEEPELDAEEPDAVREEVSVSPAKTRKRRFSRFTKVAAVVIILLLCTNIFLLGKDSSESYGDKGILHRLYQGVTGLFTDSEEQTEASDVEEFMDFDTLGEKELKKAKEFLPGLYVPTYIPEGYEFSDLSIEKYYSGDYQGIYLYKNGENEIQILQHYSQDTDVSYQLPEEGELIELSDRKLVVFGDEVKNVYWVTVYTETCIMDVSGSCDRNELVEIGKKILK